MYVFQELQRNNLDEDSIINIQELKGAFRNVSNAVLIFITAFL